MKTCTSCGLQKPDTAFDPEPSSTSFTIKNVCRKCEQVDKEKPSREKHHS